MQHLLPEVNLVSYKIAFLNWKTVHDQRAGPSVLTVFIAYLFCLTFSLFLVENHIVDEKLLL